jgi:hypothetical protein
MRSTALQAYPSQPKLEGSKVETADLHFFHGRFARQHFLKENASAGRG